MIKNMKIRKSLVMGYGITIIVSVIIIIAALILMTVQKRQYTNILEKYVESNELRPTAALITTLPPVTCVTRYCPAICPASIPATANSMS